MESSCWALHAFVGLPLLTVCAWAGLWSWIHGRRLRAWQEAAQVTLAPRAWAVVLGHVEPIGPGPAVAVEIDQSLEPYTDSDGDVSYLWHEKARRVTARPFHIVLASGQRVRVDPGGRLDFCDALDGMIENGRDRRTRTATLTVGEPVHVAGRLALDASGPGGPYRGGGADFVLRSPERGKMLISSESLGARSERKRDRHLVALVMLASDLVLTYLFFGGADLFRSSTCGEGGGVLIAAAFAAVALIAYAGTLYTRDELPWYERRGPLVDQPRANQPITDVK